MVSGMIICDLIFFGGMQRLPVDFITGEYKNLPVSLTSAQVTFVNSLELWPQSGLKKRPSKLVTLIYFSHSSDFDRNLTLPWPCRCDTTFNKTGVI